MLKQTIIEIKEGGLERKRWEFALLDYFDLSKSCLVCHSYAIELKATPRHKWRVAQQYNRLNHRDNNLLLDVPEGVLADTKRLILGQLTEMLSKLELMK